MINSDEYKKLTLSDKYHLLQENGIHLAQRYYGSYDVHLFELNQFLVEVWKRIGMSQVYWIEIVGKDVLDKYTDNINLPNK